MAYDAVRLQNLAALVAARRTALGISQDEAARRAVDPAGKPMSNTTYKRVEAGLPTRDTTYARVDVVLGWALGSCMAILNGSTAAPATGAPAPGEGRLTDLEESLREAIQLATIATVPELTGGQISELNERVITDLRKRGVLPSQ